MINLRPFLGRKCDMNLSIPRLYDCRISEGALSGSDVHTMRKCFAVVAGEGSRQWRTVIHVVIVYKEQAPAA